MSCLTPFVSNKSRHTVVLVGTYFYLNYISRGYFRVALRIGSILDEDDGNIGRSRAMTGKFNATAEFLNYATVRFIDAQTRIHDEIERRGGLDKDWYREIEGTAGGKLRILSYAESFAARVPASTVTVEEAEWEFLANAGDTPGSSAEHHRALVEFVNQKTKSGSRPSSPLREGNRRQDDSTRLRGSLVNLLEQELEEVSDKTTSDEEEARPPPVPRQSWGQDNASGDPLLEIGMAHDFR